VSRSACHPLCHQSQGSLRRCHLLCLRRQESHHLPIQSAVLSESSEPFHLSPASRQACLRRCHRVKLPLESSEPWCMPSSVPSRSRDTSTLPSAVPSTSSEPSSACSIGCTMRVQRAVELVFVHAIRGKYTVVHAILCAIKVNRAFNVTCTVPPKSMKPSAVPSAVPQSPSHRTCLRRRNPIKVSRRPGHPLYHQSWASLRRSHAVLSHQGKASPCMFHQLYHPSPVSC
jgi:hypothetical protein